MAETAKELAARVLQIESFRDKAMPMPLMAIPMADQHGPLGVEWRDIVRLAQLAEPHLNG